MIKYKLVCKDCELNFDSWFGSSIEYEKLKKKDLLTCQNCNSQNVEKTIMAPQLINRKKKLIGGSNKAKYYDIKKTLKSYQKFIKDNFKYVGENFAYEARSIHYDKRKKEKSIYGSASKQDLKELNEEGIKTQIIPWIDNNDN